MTEQTTTNEIRPYGPGKFDTILDAYVYDVSLDGGCDEELGESDSFGWYGLMRADKSFAGDVRREAERNQDQDLTEGEWLLLTGTAGVILSEDSQGFVSVEYFDTQAELETAWMELEKAYAETIEDEDEDGN